MHMSVQSRQSSRTAAPSILFCLGAAAMVCRPGVESVSYAVWLGKN